MENKKHTTSSFEETESDVRSKNYDGTQQKPKRKKNINKAIRSEIIKKTPTQNSSISPTISIEKDLEPMCRVCWTGKSEKPYERLIKPCLCSGSIALIHPFCLYTCRLSAIYVRKNNKNVCEICNHIYTFKYEKFFTDGIVYCFSVIILNLLIFLILYYIRNHLIRLAAVLFRFEKSLNDFKKFQMKYSCYDIPTLISLFFIYFYPIFPLSDKNRSLMKYFLCIYLNVSLMVLPYTFSLYFRLYSAINTVFTLIDMCWSFWGFTIISGWIGDRYLNIWLRVETELIGA